MTLKTTICSIVSIILARLNTSAAKAVVMMSITLAVEGVHSVRGVVGHRDMYLQCNDFEEVNVNNLNDF
jgi:hypothetical protein